MVQRIFSLYEEGLGYRAIADKMNSEGRLSPRDGNYSRTARAGWSMSTIKDIIDNPAYKGDLTWNRRTTAIFYRISNNRAVAREDGTGKKLERNDVADHVVVRDAHPVIIDRPTFERCQRLKRERRRGYRAPSHRTGRAKSSPYLLSGLVRCANCGHAYHGHPSTRGRRRKDGSAIKTYYYCCCGYEAKGLSVCIRGLLPRELIEDAVVGAIRESIRSFHDDGGEAIMRKLLAKALEPDPAALDRRKEWSGRSDEIDRRIDELIESLTPTNKEFVDKKLAQLKAERIEVQDQLSSLAAHEQQHDVDGLVEAALASIRSFDEAFEEGTIEERKEFIGGFVEGIEVDAREKRERCG